jgi:hypothetical protein
MLAGENSMNNGQNAPSEPKKHAQDLASGSLADSSLNEAPAAPGGPPAKDEGRHKIPENDQMDGLEKAEQAGKRPARPGPRS